MQRILNKGSELLVYAMIEYPVQAGQYCFSILGYALPYIIMTLLWTFLINTYMEAFRNKARLVGTSREDRNFTIQRY